MLLSLFDAGKLDNVDVDHDRVNNNNNDADGEDDDDKDLSSKQNRIIGGGGGGFANPCLRPWCQRSRLRIVSRDRTPRLTPLDTLLR